jgi:hypothetical protein
MQKTPWAIFDCYRSELSTENCVAIYKAFIQ